MDWKNRLEKTIGINTAIMKAEQTNFLNKKVIEDLEAKNKALHKCAYFAHNTITALIDEAEFSGSNYRDALVILRNDMEDILNERDDSEPTLELPGSQSGIIT
jgi:hypothetical protein